MGKFIYDVNQPVLTVTKNGKDTLYNREGKQVKLTHYGWVEVKEGNNVSTVQN